MKRNCAFTLVEILVVTTIISLLSIGGIVSYTQLGKQSRDSRRKADIEQIRSALESYRSDDSSSSYPADLDALIPNYLKSIPTDPKTANLYITYTPTCPTSICTTYILQGSLETGGTYQADPYGGNLVTTAPSTTIGMITRGIEPSSPLEME